MSDLRNLSTPDLRAYRDQAQARYEAFKAERPNLNLGRGKPSPEQLELSNALLTALGQASYGPLLLGIVAAGLMGFAAYSMVDARYRKV